MVQQTEFDKQMEKLEQEVNDTISKIPMKDSVTTLFEDKILEIMDKNTKTFNIIMEIFPIQKNTIEILLNEVQNLHKRLDEQNRSLIVLGNALKNHMQEQGK